MFAGRGNGGGVAATEPLVVRQLCADVPTAFPGGFRPWSWTGQFTKQSSAVILLPTSDSNQCKSFLFDVQFHGEFVFPEVCETALGRLPCRPVLSVGTTVGTQLSRLWCSFCPKQAKEWAWRGVGCFLASPLQWPFLSLLFQMNGGVTCIPSARSPLI